MKFGILITLIFLNLVSCKTTQPKNEHSENNSRFEQHMDAQGPITIEELQSEYAIFSVKRSSQPSQKAIDVLNQITEPTQVTAFFGTWCHDSQREIPELIKLKQAVTNPNFKLKLIALDREKKDNQGLAKKAGVKFTPTIVVTQQGKELGRIVEKTTQPIGLELADILDSANEQSVNE